MAKFFENTELFHIFALVMKNDYDISRQQQDDLIKAYNSVAPSCWTQKEAYTKAVLQPAPRYYVSAKQAAQVIAPMVRGDFEKVNMMLPNKKRMYYSLFQRVVELSEKRAFIGKSLAYIMPYAVSSPAPEFFCSPDVLHMVRSFLKNNHYNDDGKVIGVKHRAANYEALKAKRAKWKSIMLSDFKKNTKTELR